MLSGVEFVASPSRRNARPDRCLKVTHGDRITTPVWLFSSPQVGEISGRDAAMMRGDLPRAEYGGIRESEPKCGGVAAVVGLTNGHNPNLRAPLVLESHF